MENLKICHCDFCVEFRGTKYLCMGFYESLEQFDIYELKEFARIKEHIMLKRNPNDEWKELLQQQITGIQFRIWILKTQELHHEMDMVRRMREVKKAKLCARG